MRHHIAIIGFSAVTALGLALTGCSGDSGDAADSQVTTVTTSPETTAAASGGETLANHVLIPSTSPITGTMTAGAVDAVAGAGVRLVVTDVRQDAGRTCLAVSRTLTTVPTAVAEAPDGEEALARPEFLNELLGWLEPAISVHPVDDGTFPATGVTAVPEDAATVDAATRTATETVCADGVEAEKVVIVPTVAGLTADGGVEGWTAEG